MSIKRIPGEEVSNGPTCTVTEYGKIGDNADLAEAMINGRYPEAGFGLNRESDMMIYVVSGSGAVVQEGTGFEIHPQQAVSIDKGTKYYFEGNNLRILMISSPPWSPEQYEHID